MPNSLVYCLVQIHLPFYRKILSSHSFASGCALDSWPSPQSSGHFPQVYIIKMFWTQNMESPPISPSQVNSPTAIIFFCFPCLWEVEYPLFVAREILLCFFSSEEAEVAHVIKKVVVLIQGKRPFKITWRSGSTRQVNDLVTVIWAGSGSSGLNLDYRRGSWGELLMSTLAVLHTWQYLRSSG